MMRFDFETYLPDDVLTKVDRMSMAHSIESRVPLLDNRVIDFAATLPAHFKIAQWTPQAHPEGGGPFPVAARHRRSEEAGVRRSARRVVPRRIDRGLLGRAEVAANAAARVLRTGIRRSDRRRASRRPARSHAAVVAAAGLRALAPPVSGRASRRADIRAASGVSRYRLSWTPASCSHSGLSLSIQLHSGGRARRADELRVQAGSGCFTQIRNPRVAPALLRLASWICPHTRRLPFS